MTVIGIDSACMRGEIIIVGITMCVQSKILPSPLSWHAVAAVIMFCCESETTSQPTHDMTAFGHPLKKYNFFV